MFSMLMTKFQNLCGFLVRFFSYLIEYLIFENFLNIFCIALVIYIFFNLVQKKKNFNIYFTKEKIIYWDKIIKIRYFKLLS